MPTLPLQEDGGTSPLPETRLHVIELSKPAEKPPSEIIAPFTANTPTNYPDINLSIKAHFYTPGNTRIPETLPERLSSL